MKIKIVSAALACACCVVGSSHAASIVVSDVSVAVGTGLYNAAFVGWQLPVTLNAGQSLVLAQNHPGVANATSSYNFDLSDFGTGAPAILTWTVNGSTHNFVDEGHILTGNETAETCCYNESHGYLSIYSDPSYSVLIGYADNVHEGAGCGSYWADIEGENTAPFCAPNPFTNASIFMGAPALLQPAGSTFRCAFGEACAWDTAVIAFVPAATGRDVNPPDVPEPASLLLLGSGLLGLAWRAAKR